MKARGLYILAFMLYTGVVCAQTYNMPGGTINTCSGNFYDTGGSGGNYSNSQNITTTFCSNAGGCIRVNFTAFDVENGWDFLYVYDGPNTGSPIIAQLTGAANPGLIIASGSCLTFRFTSDGSIVRPGWAATISCSASCGNTSTTQNANCAGSCIVTSVSVSPVGFGTQELNGTNRGCLSSNEANSSWYTITIATSGNLQMLINCNPNSNDIDFGIWGPNPACPPTTAPVRCSWAAGGGTTGVHSGNNSPQTDNTEGAGGNRFVQDLPVLAGQQYLIMVDDYTSGGTLTLTLQGTATYNCSVLPIELLWFDAECKGGKVKLKWATASQTNNDYFTIERTTDGVNFEIAGTVDGAGNSSQTMIYTFIDAEPFEGTSYYRLKQTDFNGQFEYFNLVAVSCDVIKDITIFPNPTLGEFVIEGAEENSEVTVTDVLGQMVFKTKIISDKTEIDLTNQSNGIYFISVMSEKGNIRKKIMINH